MKEDQVNTFITISQELEIRGMRSKTGCSESPSIHTAQPNESTMSKTIIDEPTSKNVKDLLGKTSDNEHSKKMFPCNQSDFSSSHKTSLKRHQSSQHKTTFSCESCDYTTTQENHLKIHKSFIHRADDMKRESMDECDAELEKLLTDDQEDIETEEFNETVSDENADLEKSQLHDDLKNINSTQCPGCDKILSNKTNTIRHFKMVHLRERFPCELCSSSFASKVRVQMHIQSKH